MIKSIPFRGHYFLVGTCSYIHAYINELADDVSAHAYIIIYRYSVSSSSSFISQRANFATKITSKTVKSNICFPISRRSLISRDPPRQPFVGRAYYHRRRRYWRTTLIRVLLLIQVDRETRWKNRTTDDTKVLYRIDGNLTRFHFFFFFKKNYKKKIL